MELDTLSEAIAALARHDATCPQCEASLPDSECAERTQLKAGWRRAVREGARMIAAGGPGHSPADYGSAGGQMTADGVSVLDSRPSI